MKKRNLLLFMLLFSAFAHSQTRLPKVVLKSIEGKSVAVDTLSNNGKPLVVAFFE